MSFNLTEEGKKKINDQLRKTGFRIVREAKQRAPVDTGRLRSSITLEEEQLPNGLITVTVGSNVEYAPIQEFGSENQPAQPFLRPAARQVISKGTTKADFNF
jgi:HK97 gp10 family phage protein